MPSPYDEAFLTVWKLAQSLDLCDEAGGEEYLRVYDEWQTAGWPLDMLQFIRRRANAPCLVEKGKESKSPTVYQE